MGLENSPSGEQLPKEAVDLLLRREELLVNLGNAESDLAKYRIELAQLRSDLLKLDPELAMRSNPAESW